jgi:hypothetical protein
MNIAQADAAVLSQGSQYKEIGAFTKAFRTDELSNIEAGESFVIPQEYKVISQRMMRDGMPVLDAKGEEVTAEFINVITNTGRNVRFYPSSLTKVAFAVDPETGKDLGAGSARIKRCSGDLVQYVKGKPINDVMNNLKGCTVKCVSLNPVSVRRFGVTNEKATKADVTTNNLGEWTLVGDKKPEDWE